MSIDGALELMRGSSSLSCCTYCSCISGVNCVSKARYLSVVTDVDDRFGGWSALVFASTKSKPVVVRQTAFWRDFTCELRLMSGQIPKNQCAEDAVD